tara:strand:+ start:2076 stop:2378 length:303 start_codon:yes stop_codon:yes gene_type:complete
MKITLKQPQYNQIKVAPVGFSWTTLCFGFFPALFRGDMKWGAIQLGLAIVTSGIALFVFPFIYNKIFIKELIAKGFKVDSVSDGNIQLASSKLQMQLETV